MTLLVSDDFNRADTASGLGTTSFGAKTWSSASPGSLKITSNRVALGTGSASDYCTTVDAGQADVTVQATMTTTGGDTSLVGRYTDDSNYWLAHMDSTGPVRLFKKAAGSYTQVSPSSGSGPSAGDVVQLVFSGDTVTMKVNGSVIYTTTDSFNNTATKAGFRVGNNTGAATWDDFSVNTSSTYSAAVLADSPLLYWKLDETSGTVVVDAGGRGHNGTYAASGVTQNVVSPISGTGVTFDGVAGEAYVPWASSGLSSYNANTGARYTIEFWAKTTKVGVGVGDPAFVCASDDTGNKQFVIGLGSGNGRVTTQHGAAYAVTAGTKAVNDGAWHHVVVVFFGNRAARIYVDGAEETYTATGFDATNAGTPNVRIGRNARNTYMPATMDEFALYAGELSATRVAAHYSAGAGTLSAPLSAAASLSADASVTGIKQGVGALSAASSMTAGGYVGVTQSGATALSTTSSLSVAVVGTKTGAAALSATATLSATGTRVLKGTSALSASSTLSVDATAVGYQAGDSTLTANATLVAIAGVVASGFTLVTYTYRPTSMNTDPISPNTYGTVVGGTDASVLWTPDGDVSYVEVTHDATASNPGTQVTFRWEPVGDAAPADVSTWLSCAVSISHKQMSGPGTGWGSLDYHDPVTGNWGGNYGQDYSPGYPDVPTADGYVTQTQVLLPADLTTAGGFPHPVGPDTYWIYRMYGTYGTGGTSRLNYATLTVTAAVPTVVPAEDWAPPTLEPNGFVTDSGAAYLLGMMSGAENAVDTYYVAITKTLPTPFSDGQDLDEPDAADYGRLAVTNGSGWGRLGASFYNEVALTYTPTSNWGTYLGWAVLDSAQEGRVLFAGDLVDAVTAVSGTPFTIDRGTLAVALAVTDWALED